MIKYGFYPMRNDLAALENIECEDAADAAGYAQDCADSWECDVRYYQCGGRADSDIACFERVE